MVLRPPQSEHNLRPEHKNYSGHNNTDKAAKPVITGLSGDEKSQNTKKYHVWYFLCSDEQATDESSLIALSSPVLKAVNTDSLPANCFVLRGARSYRNYLVFQGTDHGPHLNQERHNV